MNLAWMDEDVSTKAYAWLLERTDGVAMGFVSHDRDVVIDGLRYRASPGMIPSSIAMSDDLEIDNMEIEGMLTSDAITESDLSSGRWNGARLHISLVDWENPDHEMLHIISGEFGEIARSGDGFRVEMLGSASVLNDAVAPLTSPTCRACFGDRHCKLSRHKHQIEVAVSEVAAGAIEFASLGNVGSDFAFGELRWISGPNRGLEYTIMAGAGNQIWLADQPYTEVIIGDRALLTEGCDKNFATCRDRFDNPSNFRGEPHLPGNDLLTRYPGS